MSTTLTRRSTLGLMAGAATIAMPHVVRAQTIEVVAHYSMPPIFKAAMEAVAEAFIGIGAESVVIQTAHRRDRDGAAEQVGAAGRQGRGAQRQPDCPPRFHGISEAAARQLDEAPV